MEKFILKNGKEVKIGDRLIKSSVVDTHSFKDMQLIFNMLTTILVHNFHKSKI